MFNLLPKSSIDKVKKDYLSRKVVLILLFVIFLEACFLVFLFPTWLISKRLESEASIESVRMNEVLARADSAPMINAITTLNAKLWLINTSLEYKHTLPLLDSILNQQNPDIKIRNVFYTSRTATTSSVNIEGTSVSRDSLVSFVKRLESTNKFQKVELPISNFAQDRDIIFTLNLTVNE